MEDSTQAFAWSLLSAVSRKLPADFAGLGVVFYEQLDALPFLEGRQGFVRKTAESALTP